MCLSILSIRATVRELVCLPRRTVPRTFFGPVVVVSAHGLWPSDPQIRAVPPKVSRGVVLGELFASCETWNTGEARAGALPPVDVMADLVHEDVLQDEAPEVVRGLSTDPAPPDLLDAHAERQLHGQAVADMDKLDAGRLPVRQ